MIRSDFVRRAEVHLRELTQRFPPTLFDHLARGRLDRFGDAPAHIEAGPFSVPWVARSCEPVVPIP